MRGLRRKLRRASIATPLVLVALAVSPGSAAAPTSFAVGGAPVLGANAVALGYVAAAAPMRVEIVLAPRHPAALAATVRAVSTPGSREFRHYLTVSRFAARFGASPASVGAVLRTLRADGLRPGAVAPDGLSLTATGDAGEASRAFGVSLRRYRERGGRDVFANTTAPRLPASLRDLVTAVLGLDDVPVSAPVALIRAPAPRRAHATEQPFTSGGPTPCPQASAVTGAGGPYTINQVAGAYGIGGLYSSGDLGAGVTIALYELEPYTSSDIASFQSCFNTHATVTNVEVDGGPGSPVETEPGLESALDIENAIGLAPASAIDVYQGPNGGSGPYDLFQAIVDQDTAKVISDSWGLCEPDLSAADPGTFAAESPLFEQAATQGQTILAASGDTGSEGCLAQNSGETELAVDDPASQPDVTGVGGTTLPSTSTPQTQTAWDDGDGAGGGGISSVWRMPSWQDGVVGAASSGMLCGNPSGYCREVPDVSANAAPSTGYVIYYGGWTRVGGTSAAAPVWAGLAALADASGLADCRTAPLGFLNIDLYRIAAGSGAADAFTDITSGDNNPTGTGPYSATPGHDMASGLGTPIATDGSLPGLVAQLCDDGANPPPAPPAVSAVSPADAAPGATVTVTGNGFSAGASVAFGAAAASGVAVQSATQLTATVPSGSGVVDVTVTTTGGTSAPSASDRFTYAPTESITAPVAGATYTQGQDVFAAFTCSASAVAVPQCVGTRTTGALIDTSSPGPRQFTVTATDSSGATTSTTVAYSVVAPPQVTIATPAAGASYFVGQRATVSFACATTAPVTIANCSGTLAIGAPLGTAGAGRDSFTVTATDSNGVTTTQTTSYDVVAAHPTLIQLRQSSSVWRERRHARSTLPVGTTFSFSLDQPVTLTLRFTRLTSGRMARGRCVAARAASSGARRCTRTVSAGTVTARAAAGADRLFFAGRTSAGLLAPGSYRVTLTAVGAAGPPSAAATLSFTVASSRA